MRNTPGSVPSSARHSPGLPFFPVNSKTSHLFFFLRYILLILVILFGFPVMPGMRSVASGLLLSEFGERGAVGAGSLQGSSVCSLKARQRREVPGLPQAHFLREGFVTTSTACSVALCRFFCRKSDARTVTPNYINK